MSANDASVKLIDLRKSFGPVEVLKGINLEFRAGEVHALLGANGAGKSTLLGCLSGAVRPSSGQIAIDGRTYRGFAPREALEAGVAIIYQHFQLASSLTVSDNVFLGDELRSRWRTLDKREQRRATTDVLERINLRIDPDALVGDLSVGEQQGVEIARSVRRQPRLLILDEPTAALGKHEIDALLALVRRLAEDLHVAVVYVTHLLGEVMRVADTVTILREGRVLWTRKREGVSLPDMVEAISPDTVSAARTKSPARPTATGLVALEALRTARCGPMELQVSEGEVVGIYGMLGSGRTDLLETIAGARARWTGRLVLGGRERHYDTVSRALANGVALVASDRLHQSLFPSLSARENLMMPHYEGLRRDPARETAVFRAISAMLGLVPSDPNTGAFAFSGGNAQKLVLGRWLSDMGSIRLLLLDEPTQGVDIGSRSQIYELVRSFALQAPGRAVLFATSDPEEAIALADRIVVLVNGQIARIVEPPIEEGELLSLAQTIHVEGRTLN